MSIPKLRWRWLISVLILLNLISFKGLTETLKDPGLKVLFFDVGQGDAALIRTPGGKHVLVDAGVWSPGYNSGKGIIMPHLKAENIGELDAVILSHPHADHIGGIVDILHQIPVKRIIRSGFPYESDLWRRYNHLADSLQVPIQKALPGDTLLLDPALLMVLLAPGQDPISDDPNQHSVILKMQYGTTSFLFTGDAGEEQEEELRTTFGSLLHSDVLKVGHHGSRTSSSVEFLKEVDPGISVISLGEQNRFGHPHPEAIQRLNRFSDDIRITARDKAIVLHTDGKGIQVVRWE